MSDLHWIEELREKAEACGESWWKVDHNPIRIINEKWPADAEFIEAASPDRILQLLSLLHEVSTDADPAGTVRENRMLQDKVAAQEIRIAELEERLKGR